MPAKLNADSLINDMANAAAASPIDDALGDPGVEASTIEAPGIIVDKFSGKTWTLPTGAMSDVGALLHKSPRDIKKDPNFHYEFHGLSELSAMVSQGFVPVTRKELEIEELNLTGELASPLDSYYVVDGQDICLKIPAAIAAKRYEALSDYCKAAVGGVQAGRITSANGAEEILPDGPDVDRSLNSRRNKQAPSNDELA